MIFKRRQNNIMKINKKFLFEVLVILGVLSVIFSSAYLGFITCMQNPVDYFIKFTRQLLDYFSQFSLYYDEGVKVFMFMGCVLVLVIRLAYVSSFIFHETGHLIVYNIFGEKACIIKKPKDEGRGWKTIPKTPNFDENLKRNKPKKYIYLCSSGVFLNTIIAVLLNYITALIIKNSLSWLVSILFIYTAFFDIMVTVDYIDNMWSKKSNTDGYKIREVIKYEFG